MESSQPFKDMQGTFIEEHGLVVGSVIRVLRIAKNYELGWGLPWVGVMNKLVGTEATVTKIDKDYGVRIECPLFVSGCWVPFFILDVLPFKPSIVKLTLDYDATVFNRSGDIRVGGYDISFDKLERVYLAAKNARG